MYIKDYDKEENILTDNVYESLRRSDPQLAAIPNKVSTLDRRLRMKVSRPRSLDLSNWSVDSRSSSISTSSEESLALRLNLGRSVSRNNSNASRHLSVNESENASAQKPVDDLNKQLPSQNMEKSKANIIDNPRKTVITLMGGRGYVNYRQPCCSADKSKLTFGNKDNTNCNDAHIVIWELKL